MRKKEKITALLLDLPMPMPSHCRQYTRKNGDAALPLWAICAWVHTSMHVDYEKEGTSFKDQSYSALYFPFFMHPPPPEMQWSFITAKHSQWSYYLLTHKSTRKVRSLHIPYMRSWHSSPFSLSIHGLLPTSHAWRHRTWYVLGSERP